MKQIQVIQAVPFSSPWRSRETPWKGRVFTIPKRSRLESPGGSCFCENVYDDLQLHKACGEILWVHWKKRETNEQDQTVVTDSPYLRHEGPGAATRLKKKLDGHWDFSTKKVVIKKWRQVLSYVLNTAAGTPDLMIRFHLVYYSKNGQPGPPPPCRQLNDHRQQPSPLAAKELIETPESVDLTGCTHPNCFNYIKQRSIKNSIFSWWFQPIRKILVKLDHLPRVGVKIKKY